MTKFQGKLACLQQVSNPNSQDNCQIYCADMYLVRFLANFAGFHVFWWISRDFADLVEIRGSATARNIRSPEYWNELSKRLSKRSHFKSFHLQTNHRSSKCMQAMYPRLSLSFPWLFPNLISYNTCINNQLAKFEKNLIVGSISVEWP